MNTTICTAAAVDVLVPVFNGADTIESALRSICDQTLRDIQVIVVNDGSTDDTPAILARMARADSRITVLSKDNGGIVDALNRALAISTARYIARHDADDLAFPDRLQLQFDYLESNGDCVAVGANAHHIDAGGRRLGHETHFPAEVHGDPRYVPSKEPYLMHPFLFARRAAVQQIGGYRHVFHSEDTDLYWRLADVGRLANLTECLGEYRIHPNSISSKSIINGRVAAIESQLAAVSARRRRTGAVDLNFDEGLLQAFHAAEQFEVMLDLVGDHLSPHERAYLEIASAVKLLEMSSYRPYRLTQADLECIRSAIERHYGLPSLDNRLRVVFRFMLGPRRWRRNPYEAWKLIPWRILPRVLVDLGRYLIRQ